jgi:DnaJ domain
LFLLLLLLSTTTTLAHPTATLPPPHTHTHTLGSISIGGFGIGWLRDIWRIPSYVDEANGIRRVSIIVRTDETTPAPASTAPASASFQPSFTRRIGADLIGMYLGTLFVLCHPADHAPREFKIPAFAAGVTAGIFLTMRANSATTVPPSSRWYFVFPAAAVGYAIHGPWASSFLAVMVYMKYLKTSSPNPTVANKNTKRHCRTCRRLFVWGFWITLFSIMMLFIMYHHMQVAEGDTTEGEEKRYVKLKDFFWSHMDRDTMDQLWSVWNYFTTMVETQGLWSMITELLAHLNDDESSIAYTTLGVSPSDSDSTIKKRHRTLAKKFHPDRNPGDASAAKRMEEINKAYQHVMDSRKAQARKDDIREDIRRKKRESAKKTKSRNKYSKTSTSKRKKKV